VPSTLVHVALGGLLAAALLADRFRPRTLAVVCLAVVAVDLDVFVGLAVTGAHRAAFHTLVWPAVAAVAVAYDTLARERSVLVDRLGAGGPRLAWTVIAAVVLAGIGPDLVTNGANLLYPLHDQFYAFDGELQLSSRRGVVQTFVEDAARGSTSDQQYYTGVDPDPSSGGAEPVTGERAPERVFPLVASGLQLLVVVTSAVVVAVRLRDAEPAESATTTATAAPEEE
jgi:hypothetical protein